MQKNGRCHFPKKAHFRSSDYYFWGTKGFPHLPIIEIFLRHIFSPIAHSCCWCVASLSISPGAFLFLLLLLETGEQADSQ